MKREAICPECRQALPGPSREQNLKAVCPRCQGGRRKRTPLLKAALLVAFLMTALGAAGVYTFAICPACGPVEVVPATQDGPTESGGEEPAEAPAPAKPDPAAKDGKT